MADVFSKKKRSQVMAAIKSQGNKDTELKLANILRAYGITGWRRHQKLFGKPDFVFPRERLAVFVDGCFWHGCPKHGRRPGCNRDYWIPKLEGNKRRDIAVSETLRRTGWRVLRFWAHALGEPKSIAKRITSKLSVTPRECKHSCAQHESPKRQEQKRRKSGQARRP